MKAKSFAKIASLALSLTTLTAATRASALEERAELMGRMTWILTDSQQNHYPNGELTPAQTQYFESVIISREAAPSQLFRMDITMPRTLTGGTRLSTSYRQAFRDDLQDDEVLFVNPNDSADYVRCSVFETWRSANCYEFTVRSLQQLPLAPRVQSSQQAYAGTNLATGMGELTRTAGFGGEPIGALAFFTAEQQDVPSWTGAWNISYTTPDHHIIAGKMRVDGFIGVYQPTGGNARGSLSNVFYYQDSMGGDWQLGAASGWFKFTKQGTGFVGEWGSNETGQTLGTWSGSR